MPPSTLGRESAPKNPCISTQTWWVDQGGELVSIPRRGRSEDSGPGATPLPRPTDGSAQAGKRHPRAARAAEEGPQVRLCAHRGDSQRPARVRLDSEGVRHADGRAQVRPGKGGAVPEPVPDQPVEDRWGALRPAARGADWPLQPLVPFLS